MRFQSQCPHLLSPLSCEPLSRSVEPVGNSARTSYPLQTAVHQIDSLRGSLRFERDRISTIDILADSCQLKAAPPQNTSAAGSEQKFAF